MEKIAPDPDQPREEFDEEALGRLAESLRTRGQLQPIRVRWDEGSEQYMIVVGERRWRAARMAGIALAGAVVVEGPIPPADLLAIQLVENCLREDLKPIEQARAFKALMEQNGWSARQVARELSIDHTGVARALAPADAPRRRAGGRRGGPDRPQDGLRADEDRRPGRAGGGGPGGRGGPPEAGRAGRADPEAPRGQGGPAAALVVLDGAGEGGRLGDGRRRLRGRADGGDRRGDEGTPAEGPESCGLSRGAVRGRFGALSDRLSSPALSRSGWPGRGFSSTGKADLDGTKL